jgi:HD domain
MMLDDNITDEDILEMLKPETELEHFLIQQPALRAGLLWGEPRYGHPEGRVLFHIQEIFDNIDTILPPLSIEDRQSLRLITLLHDSFKYKEDKSDPRDWSQHHSKLARRFAENFTTDERILEIIELHDDAYYCWRLSALHHDEIKSDKRFDALMERVRPFLQLYYLFFKCDTTTGDKTQAPMKWFEKKVKGIEIISFGRNV